MVQKPVFIIGFLLFVCLGLAIDLGFFGQKKERRPGLKESLIRTICWASLGLLFSAVIWYLHADLHGLVTRQDFENYRAIYDSGFTTSSNIEATRTAFSWEMLVQYLSGYFVEYSLSLDNLFVIMLVFKSFKVKHELERKILFWGVLGAIIMRFLFIFIGGALIVRFFWILYIFGAFLVYSGLKLLLSKDDDKDTLDTEKHPVVKIASRFLRITTQAAEGRFFLKQHGKIYATSLFVVLLVIEFTDVVFAVDSVPAIFGITKDPYLVFFSNIFAILGLRSLYFLLGHGIRKFHTLQYGLSLILIYIGSKMIFEHWFDAIGFTHYHNLMVLFSILFISVLFTFILPDPRRRS